MRKVLFLLLVIASSPSVAEPQALTEQAFTEEFVRVLEREIPDGGFEVTAPLEIVIGDAEDAQGTINLHNLYRNASSDPAERALQIKTYVSAVLSEPTDTFSADDRQNILPVVRDAAFVAQASLNLDDPTISEALVSDLSVLYVLDFPDRVQFLLQSNLDELELDLEEVHELAVSNLNAKSDDFQVHTVDGIYFLELDGMYESSALLLEGFWDVIETELGAAPVAAIPTRDLLLFAPSNDPLGVQLVRQLTVQIEADTGYPISTTLLIRQNGEWERYK